MKKLNLIILTLLMSLNLCAQMSTIRGVFISKSKEICLFRIEDGQNILYAKTNLAKDGSYGFTFKVEKEGFYVIGLEQTTQLQVPVYLKPGDNAEINLASVDRKEVVEYTKNNTKENKVLGEWYKLSENAKNISVHYMGGSGGMKTYKDFYPEIEKLASQTEKFKKSIKTPNKVFNEIAKEYVEMNMEFIAINFKYTPRMAHPGKDYKLPAIYDTFNKEQRFPNNNVLSMPYGSRFLNFYVRFICQNRNDHSNEAALKLLTTNEQKGVYLSLDLARLKSYDGYERFEAQYGQYMVTPMQKQLMSDTKASLADTKPGGKAINFTYPDINGKNVSLTDFIGKVVVIDVWATWCSPCRQQIPHLVKLEKEMEGKDVVFIAVSVDKEKDKEKWKQMIKEQNMGGVHLFSNGGIQIYKDYKISGIPRFIVVDKKGNLVSVSAPRPSDPQLKKMILQELAK